MFRPNLHLATQCCIMEPCRKQFATRCAKLKLFGERGKQWKFCGIVSIQLQILGKTLEDLELGMHNPVLQWILHES